MGILRDSINSERSSSSSGYLNYIRFDIFKKDETRPESSLNYSRQQETEAKREEFRKYIERAGVIDALTRVLSLLYEETEKPDDALEYICKYLNNMTENKSEVQTLRKELDEAKEQIAELEAKLLNCDLEETSA